MKNLTKLLGIIALAAAIGFGMAGCESPTDPAHVHDYAWSVTRAATCTATGEETGVCKLDATHTDTREIAINPNAHDYQNYSQTTAPTCEDDGEKQAPCTRDSTHAKGTLPITALGHDWDEWGTPTPATETVDGFKTRICKYNDSHTETEFSGEYAIGTAGLAFELIASGGNINTYRVRKGMFNGATLHIPAYHRSNSQSQYLPITEIGSTDDWDGAFGGTLSQSNTILTTVTFAENSQLKIIGNDAFRICTNIASINIPEGVTTIGGQAFDQCYSLSGITIPEGITSIGSVAFRNCTSLTNITLPASLTNIIYQAFGGCTSLTSIAVAANNPNYVSDSGILYNNAKTTLIIAPNGISGNVTIPESVTTIGPLAFDGCSSLTGITIPEAVTSIDSIAFSRCTSLSSITIPTSVTTVGGYAFQSWTPLQTINIKGHASEAEADAAWGTDWRDGCNATINYLGGQ
jgi:hypothetical protein